MSDKTENITGWGKNNSEEFLDRRGELDVGGERFLRDIFDAITDGIMVLDRKHNIIKANMWMEERYPGELPLEGKKCYRLHHNKDEPCPWCPVPESRRSGRKCTRIIARPGPDNPERWLELSTYPGRDEDGNIIGVVEYVKDISALKRTELALQGSEVRLRSILESSPDCITVTDLDGNITDCNVATLRLLGASRREELMGKNCFGFFSGEYGEKARRNTIKTIQSGGIRNVEYNLTRIDGSEVAVELSASVLRNEEGDPTGLVTVTRDITERKKAEQQLSFQAMLLDQIEDKVTATDLDGKITYVNQAECRALDRSWRDIIGESVESFGDDPEKGATQREIIETTITEGKWRGEVVNYAGDGREIILDSRTQLIRDKEGNPVGMVGISTDITGRKAIEEERENYLGELKFIADIMMKINRPDDIDEMCCVIGEAVHSVNPESYVTVSLYDRSADSIRIRSISGMDEYYQGVSQILGGDPISATAIPNDLDESEFMTDTGKIEKIPGGIYGLTNRRISRDKCERVEKILGVKECYAVIIAPAGNPMGDISILTTKEDEIKYKSAIETLARHFSVLLQRKWARDDLKEKEELLINVLESMREGILVLDTGFCYTYWNRSMEGISGLPREKALGKKAWEAFPFLEKNIKSAMESAMMGEVITDEELKYRLPEGGSGWTVESYYPLRDTEGNISGIVGVIEDITDKKKNRDEKEKLEKQLQRAQKLETIGTLAGGIAHDFNNILTPILGYTDMALSSVPESDPIHRDLEEIFNGANRARDLVRQILTFSRQSESEKKPLNLSVIVKEALKLMRSSIPSTIQIRSIIDPSCGKILADATQMHQLIVNLCTNAFQAMEDRGGVLTVELKQANIDSSKAGYYHNLNEGEYLKLSVMDTGEGMSQKTMERVFEPFFTTKEAGKGTGMGLSIVHGIVKGHNGEVTFSSIKGEGSTFTVYLPVMKGEQEVEEESMESLPGGDESIMLVDDDRLVSGVLSKILSRLGYSVEVNNSSVDALGSFRRNPDGYDLVITDLTMPDMTGTGLAERLGECDPGIPVILITGYGDKIPDDTGKGSTIREVIAKPVRMHHLASKVREVLDS